MSPASNSKPKDKRAAARVPVSAAIGIPANGSSGFNPRLGTFHTIESAPPSSPSSLHVNGQFSNIDDTEDQNGNSWGAGIEYDTGSNNGSWSGESDDHKDNKEKVSPPSRQDSIPGADNDKREKIRLKNERKHQRQKERRAQELHERCSGYLMSRKLEALAQQLVAMGFSVERATMALIMNEGKVEESVAWLFETAEEDNKHMDHNLYTGGNLKIDISEELAKITDLETQFKVAKQEVERAVVACEGDIEKAEEMLKVPRQENTAAPLKSEETSDHPTIADSKLMTSISQTAMRVHSKVAQSANAQQKGDEKDFNYTKVAIMIGSSVDPGPKSGMQALRKLPPKMELAKLHRNTLSTDRTWPSAGSSSSASYSVASSLQAPPVQSKIEAHRLAAVDDMKNLQLASTREPVIVMQRASAVSAMQSPSLSAGSSTPGTSIGWQHPSSNNLTKSSGLVSPVAAFSASLRPSGGNPHPLYNQYQLQRQQQFSNTSPNDSGASSRSDGSWSWEGASSPTLSAASSLGLFSRLGPNSVMGSSSAVDWKTGSSMPQFDYSNIDWSLDLKLLASRSNGLWTGVNYSSQNSNRTGESFGYGLGMKSAIMRPSPTTSVSELPEGGVASPEPIPVGPHFEDNSLGFSRQFVSFPSL